MDWKIDCKTEARFLITGLPGIGNVGKVVTDFLVDQLEAEKLCDIYSHDLPNSVFVTEDNLVQLPKIELYKAKDIVLLSGDSQPIEGIYEFCEVLLDFFIKAKGEEIITLGGVGLDDVPDAPKVYVTANSAGMLEKYKTGPDIYGNVGPIMGVAGLLLGLAKKRDIPAASFLAETYGHPMHLGLKGAKEILVLLSGHFDLDINLSELNEAIEDFEKRLKIAEDLKQDINYIG